jgi:hypothetical protein
MTEDAKQILYSVFAKLALKFCSETWVLREEDKMTRHITNEICP